MCNLSIFSQLFRIISGLILIALAWFGPQTAILSAEWMKLWMLGWFGIIPLISGIAAFCPIYAVLGRGHRHK
jgi:ABC-type arginine transport system permease subunit